MLNIARGYGLAQEAPISSGRIPLPIVGAPVTQGQTTRVFTVTSSPVDLNRAGTGLRTGEGRLTAQGAGGTFVVRENITEGSTQGFARLPQTQQSLLEFHIERYPTAGSTWRYVTEVELPSSRLQLDPTAPNPATSGSRWVAPNTEGARVVRHWRIVEVEDPRGFTRPVLEGPFDGPPPGN